MSILEPLDVAYSKFAIDFSKLVSNFCKLTIICLLMII